MTDVIDAFSEAGSWGESQPSRVEAFRAAGKHSARVRFLKRTMVVGSAVAVSVLVGIAVFDPFHHLGSAFSFDGIELDGSKIFLGKPRVAGFRQDGRPYEIRAATMTQDLHRPTGFDLTTVEGVIGLADKSTATLTAKTGVYDTSANSLDVQGDVRVKNDAGYQAFLEVAHVDFKSSSVVSSKPVRVFMDTTTVTADAMNVSDSGKKIVFDGHVKSVLSPAKEAARTTASLKGTAQ